MAAVAVPAPDRRPLLLAALVLLVTLFAASLARAETEVQEIRSPGGVDIWLVEDRSVPIVAVNAAFLGAGRLDTPQTAGLSSFASSLFDEGAGGFDAQAFQGRMKDLNASVSFSTAGDDFFVGMRALAATTQPAAEMLRLALHSPRFDDDAVERIRAQTLVALSRRMDDPDRVAGDAWRARAFPGHAYGIPDIGTVDAVTGFTADDVRARAREMIRRDSLLVVVVGAISADDAMQLVDRIFGGLPAGASPAPTPVEIAAPPGTAVIQRDIPQSVVVFGAPGIARDDPDFMAAYVVNYILGGGGFASRLTEEVRAKRGLAYSVYSYLDPKDESALLVGGVATQNARVAETLEIVKAEIARMGAEGPSEQELADAKTYLTGSWPLRFDSNAGIARLLLGLRLQGLGVDYVKNRNALVEAITLEDARRVARRLYDADALRTVIVGSPEGV